MKAFRFRLDAVLNLREQAEQKAQQRCAEAQRAVQRAIAQLEAADSAVDEAEAQHRALIRGGCQAGQLQKMRLYEVELRHHRDRRADELATAREQAEEARTRLVAATQAREVMEHLRHRQRRAFEYEAARADQKALDEMSARGLTLATAWQGERTEI
jgi:flagellar FliJ protein